MQDYNLKSDENDLQAGREMQEKNRKQWEEKKSFVILDAVVKVYERESMKEKIKCCKASVV